jgi:hypothetical protein
MLSAMLLSVAFSYCCADSIMPSVVMLGVVMPKKGEAWFVTIKLAPRHSP